MFAVSGPSLNPHTNTHRHTHKHYTHLMGLWDQWAHGQTFDTFSWHSGSHRVSQLMLIGVDNFVMETTDVAVFHQASTYNINKTSRPFTDKPYFYCAAQSLPNSSVEDKTWDILCFITESDVLSVLSNFNVSPFTCCLSLSLEEFSCRYARHLQHDLRPDPPNTSHIVRGN